MRHVFQTMGTVVSLTTERAAPTAAVEGVFDLADRRFSLYRPDSQLSQIAAGHLALENADEDVVALYAEAVEWRARTDGAFTPNRPDGAIDLNGIVKASTMREAGDLLDRSPCGAWTLVVGGDIVTSAHRVNTDAIGIVDPSDRTALLCSVVLPEGRRAIATSGSAERGDHIWLGGSIHSGDFAQVTVVADDIVTADVLATAIVAAGHAGFDDLCERFAIDVLTVDRADRMLATPGFRAAITEASVAAV